MVFTCYNYEKLMFYHSKYFYFLALLSHNIIERTHSLRITIR